MTFRCCALLLHRLMAIAMVGASVSVAAQAAPPTKSGSGSSYIFQCVDNQGRVLTSDRLIAQCNDREQKLMTQEGVVLRLLPPSLTAPERAALDAKQAKERAFEEANAENVRRDRQLLRRFSNEGSHNRARDMSLEPAMAANRISKQRLAALEDERKPLFDEAEFYKGKPMPAKLKQQFDGVDATEAALHVAMKAQREEMVRINELYDIELERLRKLWGGAMAGTLGPMRSPTGTPSEKDAAAAADGANSANAKTAATSTAPSPAKSVR